MYADSLWEWPDNESCGCASTASRRFEAADATSLLQHTLVPLWRVQPSPALYAAALDIQRRQRFGFYDSLIVAAALEAGCRRLLSGDLQHGQRIGALRVENPFRV